MKRILTIAMLTLLMYGFSWGGNLSGNSPVVDSSAATNYVPKADTLAAHLKSGKPTLAFFYYSVACSCTAARCAIAAAAIDSIPALQASDSLNFVRIDTYHESEVEAPYNVMIVPALVYFDQSGKEINRLEWGTSREAIKMLIEHPELSRGH